MTANQEIRIVAWETTRRCDLACRHCRAAAGSAPAADELTAAEGLRLIESLAALPIRLLILTGGEPMLRADIHVLARAAADAGIRVVMAPCGPLLNNDSAARLKRSGISAVSISLDAATAADHDAFRGVAGAFDTALGGLRCARQAGLSVQINTTVSRLNVTQLPAILSLAEREGAATLDFFFLVPTGRGRALKALQLDAGQIEQTLNWIAETDGTRTVRLKTTCAPQMARIRAQRGLQSIAGTGGCMAGRGFLFVSHVGQVQPCGFLDLACGDVRGFDFDLRALLGASDNLRRLGALDGIGGQCGACEFLQVCGGCRARANAMSGDAMAEEPYCVGSGVSKTASSLPITGTTGAGPAVTRSQPGTATIGAPSHAARIRKIVMALQRGIPIEPRPFAALARSLDTQEAEVLKVADRMLQDGSARRFGAVFDARRLGYRSELCALDIPDEALESMGALVAAHPGVTHAYLRGQPPGQPFFPERSGVAALPNLWFTLATRHEHFDSEMALLQAAAAPGVIRRLPALRRFKIDVIFDADRRETGEQVPVMPAHPTAVIDKATATLTESDRALVRALQGNIHLQPELFSGIASDLGWSTREILERLRTWHQSGILRRMALIVRHQRIGFIANAMCIWPVNPAGVVTAGRRLAAWTAVTHCYERVTSLDWPYNLYAMIHTSDWTATRRLFERISRDADLPPGRMLGSLREFKKTSMRYFVETGKASDA